MARLSECYNGAMFGRLKIIKKAESKIYAGRKRKFFKCKCICGNVKICSADELGQRTNSCGCLQKENRILANTKHGHRKNKEGKPSREHRTYWGMISRCSNKNNPKYHCYGGRGVAICQRWLGPNGFTNFLKDMGEKPIGMTLERKDNEKGYYPVNCIWTTRTINNKNRRLSVEWKIRRDARKIVFRFSRAWSHTYL